MATEAALTGRYQPLLERLGMALDTFALFKHPDAMANAPAWRGALNQPLPAKGIGADAVLDELTRWVIPHGSAVPRPGFCAFITTGGTSVATLAATAANVASPQRHSLTAFNFLEALSLDWLADLCGLRNMQGVYSSGGSTANLLALGAARQAAFERLGVDPANDGVDRPTAIYATSEAHHTIQRSAGVLGLGRRAVRLVPCGAAGRMSPEALQKVLAEDRARGVLPVAIVANAGTTNTGAIDPMRAIGELAREHQIWFHVDGAYGLPGLLDPRKAALYDGLELADSAIVDPHKWLGASVGIGATFVRDREVLKRAFTQEPAHYLEGATELLADGDESAVKHSVEDFGVPYFDYGVELSSPPRGVVVWALLREIGVEGMRERIIRHNDMALKVAQRVRSHANLELLQEPTLSICCFRYVDAGIDDLDGLNQRIHKRLLRGNRLMPSTTRVDGKLAIRPCFIGARTTDELADELVQEVLRLGAELSKARSEPRQ